MSTPATGFFVYATKTYVDPQKWDAVPQGTLFDSGTWLQMLRKSIDIDEGGSRPVSRVLSRAIIPLRTTSPQPFSSLPGSTRDSRCFQVLRPEATSLFGLAPDGVFHAVRCCHRRGALLPHRFTLTGTRTGFLRPGHLGGLLSVALSVGSRPPGVTWHLVHRSPDFPPRNVLANAPQRLPGRLPASTIPDQPNCGACP
jgi:hypothetical protein